MPKPLIRPAFQILVPCYFLTPNPNAHLPERLFLYGIVLRGVVLWHDETPHPKTKPYTPPSFGVPKEQKPSKTARATKHWHEKNQSSRVVLTDDAKAFDTPL
jgi:hypothetical protein